MKHTLEDSLARESPVSVSDIAVQNGYANAGCIRLEFPDLCQAIGRKIGQRKTQRKQLPSDLIGALAENPAPTVLAVCARLGVSSSRVYFLHLDLAHAIAVRNLRSALNHRIRGANWRKAASFLS
jgi:hypothetical protein